MAFADIKKVAKINILKRLAKIFHCQKIHPRVFKRYSIESFCRFGAGCAYYHQEQSRLLSEKYIKEINKKVDELEKVVHEMSKN